MIPAQQQKALQAAANQQAHRAAQSIIHAARLESDRILADAQGQAQAIIDAAKQHAANIKSSAREYNRRMNGPERERPLNPLYRQLVNERYGLNRRTA